MSSFFSFSAEQRLNKNNLLLKLNKLIDWQRIEQKFKRFYKKDIEDKGGERPYEPLKMFKAVLLGQWYSLSDPGLEEALNLRLDFMMFTGFELLEDCPDDTTLCKFRNKLIEKKLFKKLFQEINNQLENLGLKIKNAPGAVLDVTVIESAARPKRQIEIQDDRSEKEPILNIIESKDPDSKWLKKGSKAYFGYKGFISVDSENGYINKVHVTPANIAEVNQFSELIEANNNSRVYADKGYTSKKNRDILKEKKLKDGIMCKSSKGKKLSIWEKIKNKLISKKRYIVEQAFGTLKRKFRFSRASYMGKEKVEAQFYFKAMCFNLLKGCKMVELL